MSISARRAPRKTLGLVLGFSVSAGTMLAATMVSQPDPGRATSDEFWGHFHLEGVEASTFASLDAMKQVADVIVVGTIDRVGVSREVELEPELAKEIGEAGASTFLRVDIAVDRMMKGEFSNGAAAFELFLPSARDAERLFGLRPSERSMFFLTEKLDGSNAYRLSSTQGYLRDFGRVEPPVVSEDDWLKDLSKLSFEQLLERVEG